MLSSVNRAALIDRLSQQLPYLPPSQVEKAVKSMLAHMIATLAAGERIEIRGFGAFRLNHHGARTGRNPRTGQAVAVAARAAPRFKAGKELRERVDARQRPVALAPSRPDRRYAEEEVKV